jgi:uncharacterized protein
MTETTYRSVNSIEELEALYAKPTKSSVSKELTSLNEHYRKLIEVSPFLCIASEGPNGLDCSPRGDGPGFVHILDDKTLALPDRRGNNRLDTLKNIVTCPRVGLLFIIPGVNETLRVNGTAIITDDAGVLEHFDVNQKRPVTAIVITIEQVYFQCARALRRSNLWDSEFHVDGKTLPSPGTLIQSASPDFDGKTYDAELADHLAKTLY